MRCAVCGYEDHDRVCARCGTDLEALEGHDGEARLEILPIERRKPAAGAAPRATTEAF